MSVFLQCSRSKQIIVSPFVHLFAVISLFSTDLEKPKIGISGKGLKYETIIQRIYLYLYKKNIYLFVYRKYLFIIIVCLYDLPPYRYIGKNRPDKKGGFSRKT